MCELLCMHRMQLIVYMNTILPEYKMRVFPNLYLKIGGSFIIMHKVKYVIGTGQVFLCLLWLGE
jgi:hypothetical protein